MTTPEAPKSPDWMTPRDYAEKGHWRRVRSRRERTREELLRDWYGEDLAAFEVEANQRPERPVAEVVDGLLRRWHREDRIVLRELVERWGEIVGPAFVRHTQPAAIHEGILIIEVFYAPVKFRLEGARQEILRKVREVAGDEIKQIRLTAGGRTAGRPPEK